MSGSINAPWQDCPRIRLSSTALLLESSPTLSPQAAALLDAEGGAKRLTTGKVRAQSCAVRVVSQVGGRALNPTAAALAVTAGCGHTGRSGVAVPGKGRAEQPDGTAE